MRKHGGTPSRRDKHVTLAAISPPGVARGRFVGGQQSGLAGSKLPPLFTRETSSCSSQGRRQGEPWGASPRPSAPTYLPTCLPCSYTFIARDREGDQAHRITCCTESMASNSASQRSELRFGPVGRHHCCRRHSYAFPTTLSRKYCESPKIIVLCVTFTTAKIAAFSLALLFVCFSSVSKGAEKGWV